eukprot:TRINITY_DN22828_c0_g2_i1.p1 TRINITY_DN22828_c0_g2~~TRINITY_DN22828_c0_g2_i1.p1  ORF type:complete len:381 (+),score=31.29 TRINITY_DN22828_c0_g2_i1:47-1189(+)
MVLTIFAPRPWIVPFNGQMTGADLRSLIASHCGFGLNDFHLFSKDPWTPTEIFINPKSHSACSLNEIGIVDGSIIKVIIYSIPLDFRGMTQYFYRARGEIARNNLELDDPTTGVPDPAVAFSVVCQGLRDLGYHVVGKKKEAENMEFVDVSSIVEVDPCKFDTQYDRDYRKPENCDPRNVGSQRGGKPYYPPAGWMRFALKTDASDENWLAVTTDAWPVAYHGISPYKGWSTQDRSETGRAEAREKVKKSVQSIVGEGFLFDKNTGDAYFSEARRQIGAKAVQYQCVYVAPKITVCEGPNSGGIRDPSYLRYCEPVELSVGEKKYYYRFAFMCRVKPDGFTIHHSGEHWRVFQSNEESLRPYGLLIRKHETDRRSDGSLP